MSLIYNIDDNIKQTIAMKINENMAFPDKIKIKKAVLYTFKPKPRAQVWKDGTGKVQKTWVFPSWMKVYDTEGNCGEGPVFPDVWKICLPMMLADPEPRTNLEWRKLFYWKERANTGFFSAMFQMEMILLDLIAKKRQMPLHRMLGAERDWCDCYKGGGSVLRTDDELVEEILEIKEEGFKGTKIKISLGDYERDVRRLEKLRKAVGPDFKIAVDSNQAWDADTCMKFLREAHRYQIEWYEEPILHQEMDEIEKLVQMMKAENVYVPLAYGESAKNFDTYRSYIRAGVEVIQPMPMQYTLAEALRVAEYARGKGCRVTSGQNYYPGVLVGTLLKAGEPVEFHKPNTEYVERYFRVHASLKDGKMYLPEIPGIPVEVDFEKLEKDECVDSVRHFYR